MQFSDYIVYVDESGDHNLSVVSPDYPVFVLAFCIFNKAAYVDAVVPSFQRLKFKWFGHDAVVFHEREMRQQKPPFAFLQNRDRRNEFMADLNLVIGQAEFSVIAAAIDKKRLTIRYENPGNPYEIALKFCMERLYRFMTDRRATGTLTHCIFERRGRKEDAELELEFRRICDRANYRGEMMDCFDIRFLDKAANSSGLQISDLIARPIGLHQLRPTQQNRAFEIIERKFCGNGRYRGYGLKSFP